RDSHRRISANVSTAVCSPCQVSLISCAMLSQCCHQSTASGGLVDSACNDTSKANGFPSASASVTLSPNDICANSPFKSCTALSNEPISGMTTPHFRGLIYPLPAPLPIFVPQQILLNLARRGARQRINKTHRLGAFEMGHVLAAKLEDVGF